MLEGKSYEFIRAYDVNKSLINNLIRIATGSDQDKGPSNLIVVIYSALLLMFLAIDPGFIYPVFCPFCAITSNLYSCYHYS